MKNLFKILLGLFLVISAISCSKEDGATAVVQEFQDVVFDITNFVPQDAGKNVFVAGKDNGENDPLIPDCSDLEASYVEIMIDQTLYTLQLVTLNDKTETEVVKLAPGDYDINSFVVFDAAGVPIWASPMMGSYYQTLWNLKGVSDPEGQSASFKVDKFEKRKILIDVLCYKPFQYEEFGFAWFAYSRTEIHTICFFGDICTKFYEEFHNEGSAYFGQTYDGYDFPAMFSIVVHTADYEENYVVNDQLINSNDEWFGAGAPLCIEYPDQVGVDETFTFDIWLTLPDGSGKVIYTGTFDDTASSAVGNADGFGGSDGIFDFVVGNCSYDGNDANMELPAFIPLPETLDITVRYPGSLSYIDLEISNVVGGQAFGELYNGVTIEAWCGDLFNNISINATYTADVYSSLDINGMPANYAAYGQAWNTLNWLINNHDLSALVLSNTYTSDDIQEGIWNLIHGLNGNDNGFMAWAGIDLTSGLASVDPSILAFEPTVGDWAMVLLDPREAITQDGLVQLMIVRVDP